MAKRRNQGSHDSMVQTVANYLEEKNYSNIRADISGYDQPEKICWKNNGCHIPDATGEANSVMHIWEVETEDSIFDDHTEDQWKLFAAYAAQFKSVFHVVVPKGFESDARDRLNELEISASIHEVS